MAKKKISELPAGSALNGTELVPIVQTGTTKRITAQDIANLGNASGVEGSGTINYLAKFSATSTIANSQIFDNGTAIGIGTIIPLGLLHLFKASATTRLVMDGNASQSKIITYRTNGVQRFGMYLNNTPESGSNVGSDFQIRAYSDAGTLTSTPLFIKRSTGNVGINTTAPTEKLHVSGGNIIVNSSSAIGWGDRSAQIVGVTGASGFLRFDTNNAEVMRINESGFVGIGTTAPSRKLEVKQIGDAFINIRGSYDSNSGLIFSDIDLGSDSCAIRNDRQNNALWFSTNGINTERMRITSAGNVGIGTTNPQNKLVISNGGAQGLEIGADATYNVNLAAYNRATAAYIPFLLDASKIMFGQGNVLIGTTTDSGYKLDVNGTARLSGELLISTPDDSGMRIKAGATRLSYIDFADANTGTPSGSISYNHTSDYFVISVGGSNAEKMRVKSNTINFSSLPTSSAGLSAGDIWNDSGTLKIV
jgi:hypothetical protein